MHLQCRKHSLRTKVERPDVCFSPLPNTCNDGHANQCSVALINRHAATPYRPFPQRLSASGPDKLKILLALAL